VNSFHTKRMLGIDYGEKRIGVAVSDPSCSIATGLTTIRNDAGAIDAIREIVREKEVSVVVVGLPLSLRGGESAKSAEVRRFSAELERGIDAAVVFQDERFTSRDALATMLAMNTTRKQRREKGRLDEMAAAILLQAYLDRMRHDQNERNHERGQP
jgi:putative holliday junction resolvase